MWGAEREVGSESYLRTDNSYFENTMYEGYSYSVKGMFEIEYRVSRDKIRSATRSFLRNYLLSPSQTLELEFRE